MDHPVRLARYWGLAHERWTSSVHILLSPCLAGDTHCPLRSPQGSLLKGQCPTTVLYLQGEAVSAHAFPKANILSPGAHRDPQFSGQMGPRAMDHPEF